MRLSGRVAATFLTGLTLTLAGCGGPEDPVQPVTDPTPAPPRAADRAVALDDVPVPRHFDYDQSVSWVETFPSFRYCQARYVSQKGAPYYAPKTIASFYEDQMAKNEWSLVSHEQEGKKEVLVFDKTTHERERMRVEVYRERKALFIVMSLGDRNR